MITSIMCYVPSSVELLGPMTPRFQTRIRDTLRFQTRLTPLIGVECQTRNEADMGKTGIICRRPLWTALSDCISRFSWL